LRNACFQDEPSFKGEIELVHALFLALFDENRFFGQALRKQSLLAKSLIKSV